MPAKPSPPSDENEDGKPHPAEKEGVINRHRTALNVTCRTTSSTSKRMARRSEI
jgi:hypothetical protein